MSDRAPTVYDIETQFRQMERTAMARQVAAELFQEPCEFETPGMYRADGQYVPPGCSYCATIHILDTFPSVQERSGS